ncbi:30S ribosomal protein S7 [Candidatus Uzinura diaspidicola str. ASNER]|uniref:Small ribosomal subunit protein uS7 n=1 Tax=Candidatus Uzinura diaspidicola str. ASNER TaxID=1133592 RepID=L7VJP3_9FLAO|nr:30S ribosomal protein S7 [Candidatus Uzinura diaspidicola str. ASNER]
MTKIQLMNWITDPKYKDILVSRFVNNLMKNGKKYLAYNIFYDAMKIVKESKENFEKSELEIWKQALNNIMPHIELRSRRIGGSTFQIPTPIRLDRKVSLSMKWLIKCARNRNEKSMSAKLAAEIISAAKEEGAAVKKRIDTHKMAESNKAFSHLNYGKESKIY